ncbi:MAG: 50S ribosomal protein L4 [Alphaproteobacteria bacterium]|nr:50S ribosomal protein L4 [Alphaproteobacteria bacterium]
MKLQMVKINGEVGGEIVLDDAVFKIEPKTECLADVVRWQLARRQAGTHAVKTRGFINRTKKKAFRQKGTGNARHGAKTANIFVGGGVVFWPTPRSHAFKINKKVRILAMKSLLSIKAKEKNLIICEDLELGSSKTKDLKESLKKMKISSALFVDSANCEHFRNACSNIYRIDVIPSAGFNVYDGLRHEKLVLTKSAVTCLQERLLG